jgi:hypothetical protein
VVVAPEVIFRVTVVAVTAVMGQVPLTFVGVDVKPDRVMACPTTHGGVWAKVRVSTLPVSLAAVGVRAEVLLIVPIRP